MTNQLAQETSPYLLQHKDNPVHWRPWGPKALAEAEAENKPILLSVGYAACHWCHVMAHESFEDDETAKLMNELFVNIKVDREERPDIDQIYMEALQHLGQQGGWPLTMFLTSDGAPFWGGTYFPNEAKYGQPGFRHVLQEIARLYREAPEKVTANKDQLIKALSHKPGANDVTAQFSPDNLADIAQSLLSIFDGQRGGVSGAPKFPHFSVLELLWRAHLRSGKDNLRNIVLTTLNNICQGGIYDHLGGAMARYSVDPAWLVPHFEKMLYDNAQLVSVLALISRGQDHPLFHARVTETVEWLLREMTTEEGGFASSLDADSEGVEGKFYVWTHGEIETVLGPERAKHFSEIYGVTEAGNWEGSTILHRLNAMDLRDDDTEQALAKDRGKLLAARGGRVRPGLDDKVLADWNGLMISALAYAALTFDSPAWLKPAEAAFDFIARKMTGNGRLKHSYRLGDARHSAMLDDYANMIDAAIALYEATAKPSYLDQASSWMKIAIEHYWDSDDQGFYFTPDDADDVLVRTKIIRDDATPNGNATMMANLVKLYYQTGVGEHHARAEQIHKRFAGEAARSAFYHAAFFNAFELLAASSQIVIMSPQGGARDRTRFLSAIYRTPIRAPIIAHISDGTHLPGDHPAHGKMMVDNKTTLYLCQGTSCSLPITDPEKIGELVAGVKS